MVMGWRARAMLVLMGLCWAGAGCGKAMPREPETTPPSVPIAPNAGPEVEPPSESPTDTPDVSVPEEDTAPSSFRPAFHQTLSGSVDVARRTTYRFRVPWRARAGVCASPSAPAVAPCGSIRPRWRGRT